jgi:hypothetical protein
MLACMGGRREMRWVDGTITAGVVTMKRLVL